MPLPAPPGHRPRGKTARRGGRGSQGRHQRQAPPPPPQVFPVEMNGVKGILREFDRGAYGEAFRGDRLVKIAVLGKGEGGGVSFFVFFCCLSLVKVFCCVVPATAVLDAADAAAAAAASAAGLLSFVHLDQLATSSQQARHSARNTILLRDYQALLLL